MLASSRSQQKLYALAVAIEASAGRDPYPRLAELMRNVEFREARGRFAPNRIHRPHA